jgi:hypothetical protein
MQKVNEVPDLRPKAEHHCYFMDEFRAALWPTPAPPQ